jgi:hypothetical protein
MEIPAVAGLHYGKSHQIGNRFMKREVRAADESSAAV